MKKRISHIGAACIGIVMLGSESVNATELVYQPINPSFGGSPLNGATLLNEAQAEKKTKDRASSAFTRKTPLEQFSENLQRYVLNRISSSVTGSIIGPSGEIIPGKVETQDFVIQIVDKGANTLEIITTDKNTGKTTSFEVVTGL